MQGGGNASGMRRQWGDAALGDLYCGAGSGRAYHPALPLQHLDRRSGSRTTHHFAGGNMMPTPQTCVERIQTCISDLSENGINLIGADDHQLAKVVREHLEYFQLMLGYDSDAREVLDLIKKRNRLA
jgi:hypothetical protein